MNPELASIFSNMPHMTQEPTEFNVSRARLHKISIIHGEKLAVGHLDHLPIKHLYHRAIRHLDYAPIRIR